MKTLKQLANNQVVICETLGEFGVYQYEFYSYGTHIATYREGKGIYSEKDTLLLTEYYDYSRTTSKYLKIFLQDFCGVWYKDTNELRKYIKQGGCGNVTIQVI